MIFYAAMQDNPHYQWIEQQRAGRILIGTSVWEDLAKILMTTNTTWSQTISMIERLCSLGEPFGDSYAFPSPQQIASLTLDDLAAHIRVGYRAPYLHELAQAITSGDVDVEGWYRTNLHGDELYKQVKSLKGFGNYAAGTLLRMLGHFDRLAIDSACRTAYRTHYNKGEKATDKAIHAYYEPFGKWRGLAMWFDIMKE